LPLHSDGQGGTARHQVPPRRHVPPSLRSRVAKRSPRPLARLTSVERSLRAFHFNFTSTWAPSRKDLFAHRGTQTYDEAVLIPTQNGSGCTHRKVDGEMPTCVPRLPVPSELSPKTPKKLSGLLRPTTNRFYLWRPAPIRQARQRVQGSEGIRNRTTESLRAGPSPVYARRRKAHA